MNIDFKDYLKVEEDFIYNILKESIEDYITSPLYPAISYALLSPGKRLRPILTIITYEAFSKDKRDLKFILPPIEMIHTYSLIHDDLPVMDNSSLRRGRPTVHVVYGEDLALLAGDTLLTLAFEILSRDFNIEKFNASKIVMVINELSKSAGITGMLLGQTMDTITFQDEKVEKNVIDLIHLKKTAELIKAPIRIGAILADANSDEISILSKIGENIGLAYQISDDILDVTGKEEDIGKEVGQDKKNRKATYPYLFGIEKSKNEALRLFSEAKKDIDKLKASFFRLKSLVEFLESRV